MKNERFEAARFINIILSLYILGENLVQEWQVIGPATEWMRALFDRQAGDLILGVGAG